MTDKEFPEGFGIFLPHKNAPDFVIADISITPVEFGKWLKEKYNANPDDKVRLQVLRSRGGKYYVAVNDFKPKSDAPAVDGPDDDIPF